MPKQLRLLCALMTLTVGSIAEAALKPGVSFELDGANRSVLVLSESFLRRECALERNGPEWICDVVATDATGVDIVENEPDPQICEHREIPYIFKNYRVGQVHFTAYPHLRYNRWTGQVAVRFKMRCSEGCLDVLKEGIEQFYRSMPDAGYVFQGPAIPCPAGECPSRPRPNCRAVDRFTGNSGAS